MSLVNSLVKGSCTPECSNKGYSISGGDLTNGDCNWSFPLDMLSMSLCDVSKSNKNLQKYQHITVSGACVGFASQNAFYIGSDETVRSINTTLEIASAFKQDGSVISGSAELTLTIDDQEMVITWNNFHLKPINYNSTNWDESNESWLFYSVSQSTTNVQMSQFSDIVADISFLETDTANVTFSLVDSYGRAILFDVTIDKDGVYTIDRVYGYSIRFRTIFDENTSSMFFRDVMLFDKCEKLYLSMLGTNKVYHILNEDFENQEIRMFFASMCPQTTLSTCCCNS